MQEGDVLDVFIRNADDQLEGRTSALLCHITLVIIVIPMVSDHD